MATTATIALSSATVKSGQTSIATVTLTNGGSVAVNVTSAELLVTPHSGTAQSVPVAVGRVGVGGAFTTAIAGSSGTLALSGQVLAHAPITSLGQGGEASQYVYDVGAIVTISDGSVVSPTVTTLTVNYPAT